MIISILVNFRIDWRFFLAFPLGMLLTSAMVMLVLKAIQAADQGPFEFVRTVKTLPSLWMMVLPFSPLVLPGALFGWSLGWFLVEERCLWGWLQVACCGAMAGLFAFVNLIIIVLEGDLAGIGSGNQLFDWVFFLSFPVGGALVALPVYTREWRSQP